MRNLKRALSLALASVMLLGMMVVGTSAASYADVSSKNNLEAIEVLKLVGVMTGDDKGNFNPDANVTRNEMAVIMCNLLGLKTGGSHPFTDVPAWAAPFVAACYNNGIIAGVSATQFNGDANVTAVQASLMVMKALGYFGYAGEFGDNWKLSVVKQASKIDLYDGINAYTDQVMTRNEVAQLVLNALESTIQVVTEQGGVQVDGNGVSVNVKATYTYEDAKNNSGKDYAGKADKSTMELCEKLYGSDLKKDTTASTSDDFGRPATKWTYNNDSVTSAKSPDLTYTKATKGKDIYEDLGKVKGVKLLGTNDDEVYVDGRQMTAANHGFTGFAIASGNNVKVGNDGSLTEVYYDKDTKVATVVVVNPYLAKATEDYDTKDEEVDVDLYGVSSVASATLSGDDFAVSDVKEDDYLIVNLAYNDAKSAYEVQAVAKPTVVENATVSNARSDDYVTANGTKYSYAAISYKSTGSLGKSLMNTPAGYDLNGDGYNLYLNDAGYVVGIEGYDAGVKLDDYLFVKETSTNGFDAIAKALFADGTTKTITIDKLGSTDIDKQNYTSVTASNFYKFKTDKDGNYELTVIPASGNKVVTQGSATGKITSAANPIVDANGNKVTGTPSGNSSTVFIAKDKVFTGVKNAPEVASSTVYYLTNEDGRLMLVYSATAGSSKTTSDDLVYILSSKPAVAKDGDDTYYIYTAIVDGKKGTLESNDNTWTVGLYKLSTKTDGRYDLGTQQTTASHDNLVNVQTSVASADYSDGTLVLGSTGYLLDDNVTIFTIDGTTVKTISASGVKNAVEKDHFDDAYTVEVSSSNDDIITVYLVK